MGLFHLTEVVLEHVRVGTVEHPGTPGYERCTVLSGRETEPGGLDTDEIDPGSRIRIEDAHRVGAAPDTRNDGVGNRGVR